MIHSFETEDAAKYGLIEAVMLNNFRYWISHNEANRVHEHDGRTWTYNSVKAFEELFPYLTNHQIRRCIESLVSQGVLVRGNFNLSAYDKTSWFAFSDVQKGQIDVANLPNRCGDSAQIDVADLPNRDGNSAQSEADIKTILKTIPINTTRGPEIAEKTAIANAIFSVDDVDSEIWTDFVKLRKAKKSPLTKTAVDCIRREAEMAGWTMQAAIAECCARGWSGFKADWVADKSSPKSAVQNLTFAERDRIAGMQRWEQSCNQRHPDLPDEFSAFRPTAHVINVTPQNLRISQ